MVVSSTPHAVAAAVAADGSGWPSSQEKRKVVIDQLIKEFTDSDFLRHYSSLPAEKASAAAKWIEQYALNVSEANPDLSHEKAKVYADKVTMLMFNTFRTIHELGLGSAPSGWLENEEILPYRLVLLWIVIFCPIGFYYGFCSIMVYVWVLLWILCFFLLG